MKNLIKSVALVAAFGVGTTAAAEATFGFQETVSDDSSITIDLVRTSATGTLAIYDYSGGEFGALLGSTDLEVGANADVVVPLDENAAEDLAAVIYEGSITEPSMAANWIELDVRDNM